MTTESWADEKVEPLKQQLRIMVSGHTDLSREEFEKYYVPALLAQLSRRREGIEVTFVVGGADGCDKMTQVFLAEHEAKFTVFDKGEQRNIYPISPSVTGIQHVNGFKSYPERDAAMTAASDVDIAFLSQYGGAGSGTAANLYRRQFGDPVSKQILEIIRNNSMPFDKNAKKRLNGNDTCK